MSAHTKKPRLIREPAGTQHLRMITRWIHIIRPAIVTATLGLALIVLPPGIYNKVPMAIILVGTYVLSALYVLAHRIKGINTKLMGVEIGFDIFIITVIIHYTGTIESSFVGFYFLAIMCASFYFRRLVTMLFTSLAAAFYAAYILLYLNLTETAYSAAATYNVSVQVTMYVILMYTVGVLSSSLSERILKKDTALISALKLLREARLDTSDILQSMSNGLLTITMTGYIVYCNRAAASILRLGGSLEGRRYDLLFGERFSELTAVVKTELTGKAASSDHEITVYADDGAPIPIGLTIVPLYDIDRSRRGIIINFKDLTEKQKLMEMLRQSDRMAAIGELSAAIAHEIRNPLASIGNAAELLQDNMPESDKPHVTKLLSIIEKESERLQRISNDFLAFARVRDPESTAIPLKRIIDDILLLIANDPRNTGDVSINNLIGGDLVVLFDEDHLKQCLINIIINALDALDGSGEIVLTTERNAELAPGYLRLIIYDSGPGFVKEAAGRMFEPFFSTKGGGTGLGLAQVRKLVIANNGRILARNRDGAGAELALDIPLRGDD